MLSWHFSRNLDNPQFATRTALQNSWLRNNRVQQVKVRYSGAPQLIPLADLIKQGKLTDFLRHQYPDVERGGGVQFVPEIRGRVEGGVQFVPEIRGRVDGEGVVLQYSNHREKISRRKVLRP